MRRFGLDAIGIKDDLLKTLKSNMDKEITGRKDAYVLKDFTNYFNESVKFKSHLDGFKEEIIKEVFSLQHYVNIYQRIRFFYSDRGSPPPPEPLCSKLYRLIFTQAPPPYKYDYGIPNPSSQTFDDMICGIKKGYVYDIRSSRSNKSFASNRSLGRLSTASNNGRMQRLSRVASVSKVTRKSTRSTQIGFGILNSTRDMTDEDEDKN